MKGKNVGMGNRGERLVMEPGDLWFIWNSLIDLNGKVIAFAIEESASHVNVDGI